MKKSTLISALTLLCVLAIPAVASAEKGAKYTDKAGRFGIGGDSTLGGVGGLSARFQVAKNFGVQAVIGFSRIGFATLDANDEEVSNTTIQQIAASLRGDIGLAYTNKASLSIVFGVDIFNDSTETTFNAAGTDDVSEGDTRFAFEAGLKAEYHFSDYFSVHTEVGFVFALVNRASEIGFLSGRAGVPIPTAGDGGGSIDGSLIFFGLPDSFGSAGFTFWFK